MSGQDGKPFAIPKELVWQAWKQVKANGGAAGADGVTIEAFEKDLKDSLYKVWNRMSSGTYFPPPVRAVEIPKAAGGMRPLGIPTVLDRFIQQAMMQVLQADWDRTFSESSFGFLPGRSAHQAVARAQALIAAGYHVVVDIDLEKFFDRVNHDILMGLVAKRVTDKRILKLIRGFLTAGALADGLVSPTEEGTPRTPKELAKHSDVAKKLESVNTSIAPVPNVRIGEQAVAYQGTVDISLTDGSTRSSRAPIKVSANLANSVGYAGISRPVSRMWAR